MEETRKRLFYELNTQFENNSYMQEQADHNVKSFAMHFDKPKLFEPKSSKDNPVIPNTLDVQSIKGIGFEPKKSLEIIAPAKQYEIYNMKELIQSNPESMRTFSYDTKVVKAQLALVKKKDWQDILFSDIDWFKKIDLTSGMRKLFRF